MMDKTFFLRELKNLLAANFGGDIKDVILFGSRARGEAHKHSDYDILIILDRDYDWQFQDKITSVLYGMELEYDIFIDAKVISMNELHNTIKGSHPMYADAIREGIHA